MDVQGSFCLRSLKKCRHKYRWNIVDHLSLDENKFFDDVFCTWVTRARKSAVRYFSMERFICSFDRAYLYWANCAPRRLRTFVAKAQHVNRSRRGVFLKIIPRWGKCLEFTNNYPQQKFWANILAVILNLGVGRFEEIRRFQAFIVEHVGFCFAR